MKDSQDPAALDRARERMHACEATLTALNRDLAELKTEGYCRVDGVDSVPVVQQQIAAAKAEYRQSLIELRTRLEVTSEYLEHENLKWLETKIATGAKQVEACDKMFKQATEDLAAAVQRRDDHRANAPPPYETVAGLKQRQKDVLAQYKDLLKRCSVLDPPPPPPEGAAEHGGKRRKKK